MKKIVAAMVAAIMFAPGLATGDIITQWNFNSAVPDGNTATGTTVPNIGMGIISVIGGVVNPGFNSGTGSSDSAATDNSGFQTETYPVQSTASGTAGVRFNVSTFGFQDITGSFDLRLSNTSSRWYQVRYTTDGTTFLDLGAPVRLGAAGQTNAGDTWFNSQSFDLSTISGVNNNANFGLQVVSVFSPDAFTQVNGNISFGANAAYEVARNPSTGTNSAYAGGTWRFDMATFSGNAVPEASSMAVLCLVGPGFAFRRRAGKRN